MKYYSETFTIRTDEVDRNKLLTIPALLRLCMETAMKHAEILDVSVWTLEKSGMAWVLSRNYIDLFQTSKLGQQITIRTQPAGYDRLFTYRDFEIRNASGELVGKSSSSWLMFDIKQRKRIALPKPIKEILNQTSKEEPYPRPPLRVSFQGESMGYRKYKVGYFHLDYNEHMSNLFYPEWILEPLGLDWLANHRCKRIDILYQSECYIGDKIVSNVSLAHEKFTYHQLVKDDGKNVLVAKSHWELK